jgi:UDPglucose--hexose-1-phosphate uridylyltransferase
MSEFRYDWFSDRWVIFAPQRSHRPQEFSECAESSLSGSDCPFCTGNESETPVPVLMLPTLDAKKTPEEKKTEEKTVRKERGKDIGTGKSSNSERRRINSLAPPSWKVRVVPNKYPALKPLPDDLNDSGLSPQLSQLSTVTLETPEPQSNRKSESLSHNESNPRSLDATVSTSHQHSISSSTPCSLAEDLSQPMELFHSGNFHGAHEVFVECGEHKTSLTELPTDHVQLILHSYAARLRFWRSHKIFQYGVVFKNSGAAAGATLSHLHSQLMVTSFLPTEIQQLNSRWSEFTRKYHICPVCNMLKRELADSSRLVWESEHFVAICPYASRSPYFISIFPRQHQATFETSLDAVELELASYLLRTIKALESALSNASYNYVIHTSPFSADAEQPFHWRIDLFPRLGKLAGFEWASGSQINSILPEEAARTLRLYFATSS